MWNESALSARLGCYFWGFYSSDDEFMQRSDAKAVLEEH